ncbi:nucleoside recognition domain-containing protein [Hathewaya histolytica]|uniref:Nucleoside recognition domain-containing protein n=1 Tax=Hathewaya histolytica TaxID=1498 RepID=A0A4U9RSR8_HATHI|nr:nucleoside recognition domain-containing protein [Hathewaya histolytica]VTQ94616.1 nucleoside recognition domain-containing protein [Hathewaya histolytica]
MINIIWFFLIVSGIGFGIFNGRGEIVSKAIVNSAGSTVQLIINLVGILALWCGVIKILQESGVMRGIAKLLKPVLKVIFRDEARSEKAMEAIIMNLSANMMGVSNAATPAGIKAMEEMQKLNPDKSKASNDMVLFLVLNATCIQLLPTTIISVRAAYNSKNPAIIILPAIISTAIASIAGIVFCKILQKYF